MKGICFFLALVCLGGCGEAPDSAYVDISIPGVTIAPGEDKTICFYTTYEGEDTGIWRFEPRYTQEGHNHLLVMTTDGVDSQAPPPGQWEDCSNGEALKNLRPLIFPTITLGKENAVPLAKGTPIVLHSHYINASLDPIVVHDVARLYKADPAEVDQWIAPMALASFNIDVPPDQEAHTLKFSCEVPWDMNLRLLGGHMHEHGESISISYEEGGVQRTIYSVEAWNKEEDSINPPIWPLSYELSEPLPSPLVKSSMLSVSCTWMNTSPDPSSASVSFPREMCAAFGYVEHVGPAGSTIPTGDDRFFFCSQKGEAQ
jgi:hypothetical protein